MRVCLFFQEKAEEDMIYRDLVVRGGKVTDSLCQTCFLWDKTIGKPYFLQMGPLSRAFAFSYEAEGSMTRLPQQILSRRAAAVP